VGEYWKTRVVWCIEVLVTMGKVVVLMWTRLVRGKQDTAPSYILTMRAT
jgi:hypothetical protein